jgi:hypothetical protein
MSDPISFLIATYILLLATNIITAAFYVTMATKSVASRSSTGASRERLPFSPLRGLCLRNSDAHYKDPQIRRKPWKRQKDLLGLNIDVVDTIDSKGFLVGQKLGHHQLVVHGDLTKMQHTRFSAAVPGTLRLRRGELNYTMSRRRGAEWETIKDPTPRREVGIDIRAKPNQKMAEKIKRELELAEERRIVQREKRTRFKKARAVALVMDGF